MSDPEVDDMTLLTSLAHGHDLAYSELYDRHAPAVLRYAWRLTGKRPDVEELLQDTFLTLWDKRRSVRIYGDSLLPWLLTTCRHHALNLRRRDQKHTTLPLDESAALTAEDAADEQLQSVHEEIGNLGTLDRQVCELCLIQGLDYTEAGKLLGISANAVGKRLQRVRQRLRKAATNDAL